MIRNIKNEQESLTNFLGSFTKDESLIIHPTADGRSKKYAISKKGDFGSITPLTIFMNYDEMNCFFLGMLTMEQKRIKF